MRLFIILFITVVSVIGFVLPCKAQSLFSGLILSEKEEGLKIVGIQSGTPGHDAGLRADDIVLEIEGKKVKTIPDYVNISRGLKNKKTEVSLVILRKGVEYDVDITAYSIPIYKHWNEKVSKPIVLPKGLTNTPYVYWVGKGFKSLKKIVDKEPIDDQIANYNTALRSLLNALHYRPDSIDAALQIASVYHTLGNLYVKKGIEQEGIKNYRKSMTYYGRCYKKTQEEDYLNKILTSLQEIEKEVSGINSNKFKSSVKVKSAVTKPSVKVKPTVKDKPSEETKRESLRIMQ